MNVNYTAADLFLGTFPTRDKYYIRYAGIFIFSEKCQKHKKGCPAGIFIVSGGGGWPVTALFMVLFAQRGSTRALSAWLFIGGPDAAA